MAGAGGFGRGGPAAGSRVVSRVLNGFGLNEAIPVRMERPIPEAPTWVMTTIGFSVVVFLFRKKKRNRVIPISIIDVT